MKKVILPCIMILWAISLNAQPNITATNNPVAGDNFASLPLDTASVQPGTPGTNKTWDFTSLVFIYNPLWDNYVTASGTIYASSFPNANVASFTNVTSGEFTYHKTSSTGWEIHGFANNLFEFIYSNIQQVMTYPFTYNSEINDTYGGTTSHSGMTIVRTGTFHKKGIAYGGLQLPTGNFSNILLIQTDNDCTDSYSGSSTLTKRFNVTEYSWVSPAYRYPLLFKRIEEEYYDNVLLSTLAIARVSTKVSGIDAFSDDDGQFAVYPLPASTELNLGFYEMMNGKIVVDCYNLSGQRVQNMYNGNLDPAQTVLTFDVSKFSTGMYFLRIQSDEGVFMRKFVIR